MNRHDLKKLIKTQDPEKFKSILLKHNLDILYYSDSLIDYLKEYLEIIEEDYKDIDFVRSILEPKLNYDIKKYKEKYKEYNWIHAYPNVAAEIIALWYGNDEFEKTCHIIAMEGQDADCTAAPVLNALLCMIGLETVGEHWIKPIGKNIATLMRRMRNLTIDELCEKTVNAVRKATA